MQEQTSARQGSEAVHWDRQLKTQGAKETSGPGLASPTPGRGKGFASCVLTEANSWTELPLERTYISGDSGGSQEEMLP